MRKKIRMTGEGERGNGRQSSKRDESIDKMNERRPWNVNRMKDERKVKDN